MAMPPRAMTTPPEVQRLPVSQQGNMPVMISLQGHVGVPPSPDKARGMPMMVNPQVNGPLFISEGFEFFLLVTPYLFIHICVH